MKMRLFLPFCLCLWTLVAAAQTTPTPEMLNQPAYCDRTHHALKTLEKASVAAVTHTKGIGGYSLTYELDGAQSSIRLPLSDSNSFVVRLSDGMGDPSGFFSLFRVENKKGKRVAAYLTGKVGLFSAKSGAGSGIIPYEVRQLGGNLFEIIPGAKLDKGEYFFVNKGTLGNYSGQKADAFAFGID